MSEGEVRDYRSLGEVLRQSREAKGWSLEELSERTRIAPPMIAALEHDDLGRIGNPVYARGFIRNIAVQLGLDPDWLLTKVDLRDATSAVPESVKRPMPVAPISGPVAPVTSQSGPVWQVESVRVRRVETGPKVVLPWGKIALGIGVLAVLGLVLWLAPQWMARPDSETELAVPRDHGLTPVVNDSSGPVRAEIEPEADVPAAGGETAGGVELGGETMAPTHLEAVGSGPEVRSLPSVISPDPDRQRQMTLIVRARMQVEVTVAADGQPARQRLLRAGETWTLLARDHFSVQASDPAAIEADLDGVRRAPPPGWTGNEWLLYPLPEGRGER